MITIFDHMRAHMYTPDAARELLCLRMGWDDQRDGVRWGEMAVDGSRWQ